MTTETPAPTPDHDAVLEIARAFVEVGPGSLSTETRQATKRFVLDCLGVLIAGSRAPGCQEAIRTVSQWGGAPQATILASGERLPRHWAAFANAMMARALDFDDVFEQAINHTSATVVPTALAMAESTARVSGNELLTAIALGRDLICRLSLANRNLVGERSRSQSYPYNAFAAAAVTGRFLKLSPETIVHAMGLTYGMAISNRQGVVEGTHSVRIHQGMTAHVGIVAAELAAAGATAAKHLLEGRYGYYASYENGAYDRQTLLDGLGIQFLGLDGSIKPYPVCKQSHTAIRAAIELRQLHQLEPSDIERVVVGMNEDSCWTVCWPRDGRHEPLSSMDVQFSAPWVVALALLNGRVDLSDLEEASFRDAQCVALAQRVECHIDPEIEADSFGRISPARLTIWTRDGRTLRHRVDTVPGHKDMPLSQADLEAKFRSCMRSGAVWLSNAQIDEVIDLVNHLEEVDDVRGIIQRLVPAA